jgi:hypothetical protein
LFGWNVRLDIDDYAPAKRKELDYLGCDFLSRNAASSTKAGTAMLVLPSSNLESHFLHVRSRPAAEGSRFRGVLAVLKDPARPLIQAAFSLAENKTPPLWIPLP